MATSNSQEDFIEGEEFMETIKSQEQWILIIEQYRETERNAKSRMTRVLNKLASVLSGDPRHIDIIDLLQQVKEQMDSSLRVMSRLERAYRENKDPEMASKVSDEADLLFERVDLETASARSFLASSSTASIADSQASERRREREKAEGESRKRKEKKKRIELEIAKKREELERQEREVQSAKEESNKRRDELENEADEELCKANDEIPQSESSKIEAHVNTSEFQNPAGPKSTKTEAAIKPQLPAKDFTVNGQLERICIPIFSGNKMDFQRWNAAFTSSVDLTSLSPQFKMVRLEACLTGEAADTIKGLGYSLKAYEAAKARLLRKYGGSRRQVQSHLKELKKLKPIRQNNAKELEIFADVLERAVITL